MKSAADRLASLLDRPKPKRTRTVRSKQTALEVAERGAQSRASAGDWEGASGKDLVGLYAFCHRSVYGAPAGELANVGQFRAASKAAAKMIRESFDGDVGAAVDFVRWTWLREREREEWAAENRRNRGRLGWRLAFSERIVTDYRVAMSRLRRRG